MKTGACPKINIFFLFDRKNGRNLDSSEVHMVFDHLISIILTCVCQGDCSVSSKIFNLLPSKELLVAFVCTHWFRSDLLCTC